MPRWHHDKQTERLVRVHEMRSWQIRRRRHVHGMRSGTLRRRPGQHRVRRVPVWQNRQQSKHSVRRTGLENRGDVLERRREVPGRLGRRQVRLAVRGMSKGRGLQLSPDSPFDRNSSETASSQPQLGPDAVRSVPRARSLRADVGWERL